MNRHKTGENDPAFSPNGRSLLRRLTGNRRFIDFAFRAAVVMKAIYGAGEVTVGILLALIGSAGVNDLIATITAPALAANPHDIMASTLMSTVAALTGGLAGFVVVYLIAHGSVKIVLLWALVTRRTRVYPWAIILLTGFVVYQVVETVVTFSLPLLSLTIVDTFIITLTFREWRMTQLDKNKRDNERDHDGGGLQAARASTARSTSPGGEPNDSRRARRRPRTVANLQKEDGPGSTSSAHEGRGHGLRELVVLLAATYQTDTGALRMQSDGRGQTPPAREIARRPVSERSRRRTGAPGPIEAQTYGLER